MRLKPLNNIAGFSGMEFGTFRLKEGMSEHELIKTSKMLDQEFLCKEDGFLGHVILKGEDGLYIDLAFATTQEKAEQICAKWMSNEFALKYLEFFDPESVKISFWTRIK